MFDIDIRPLDRFVLADLERIGGGFRTSQVYRVRKIESDGQFRLQLDLVDLPAPLEKRFPRTEDIVEYYEGLVRGDFALGGYAGDRLAAIALADVQAWNGTLLLWEFHVEAGLRGRGIGRRLMDALVTRAKAAGLRVISAETGVANVPAIRFYRRLGFSIDAVDLSFYSNEDVERGEVTLFMKRRL